MTERTTNPLTERLGIIYGKPDSADPVAFIAAYAKITNKYADSELEAAAERILKTRKVRSWPTVGECVAALEDHRAERYRPAVVSKHPEWSQEAEASADKAIDSDIGRQAAQQGWLLGLHNHFRRMYAAKTPGRLPTSHETVKLMKDAKYVQQCADGAVAMGHQHEALLKYARSMRAKESELGRKVVR